MSGVADGRVIDYGDMSVNDSTDHNTSQNSIGLPTADSLSSSPAAPPAIIGLPPSPVCFAMETILSEWYTFSKQYADLAKHTAQLRAEVDSLTRQRSEWSAERSELTKRIAVLEFGVKLERTKWANAMAHDKHPNGNVNSHSLAEVKEPDNTVAVSVTVGDIDADKENDRRHSLSRRNSGANHSIHYFTLPSRFPPALNDNEESRALWRAYVESIPATTILDRTEQTQPNTGTAASASSSPSTSAVVSPRHSTAADSSSSSPSHIITVTPAQPSQSAHRSNIISPKPNKPATSSPPSTVLSPRSQAIVEAESVENTARVYNAMMDVGIRKHKSLRANHEERLPSITNSNIFSPPQDTPPSPANRSNGSPRHSVSASATSAAATYKPFKPKLLLRSHTAGVRHVAFDMSSPSTANTHSLMLGSASEDCTAKLWSLAAPLSLDAKRAKTLSLEPVRTFRGHTQMVTAVLPCSARDIVVTASMDSHVLVWDYPQLTSDDYQSVPKFNYDRRADFEHAGAVWSVAVPTALTSNILLTAATDGVYVWTLPKSGTLTKLRRPSKVISNDRTPSTLCTFARDGSKAVVGYTSGEIALIDVTTGQIVSLHSDDNAVGGAAQWTTAIVSVNDRTVLTGHADHRIRMFDPLTDTLIHSHSAHNDCVTALTLSTDSTVVVSASHDETVRVWDISNAANWKCLHQIDAHNTHRTFNEEAIHCVTMHSTMPIIATCGADNNIRVSPA